MILRNEDLINKLGSRESIDNVELLRKINDRKFYVYVDNKPFKGFDSLSVWKDCIHFYCNESIKYDLIDSYDVKTETDISIPFENCFNMSLVIGDETINIYDYKTIEEPVEIRKGVLSIGDYIRIHYYGTNHGDYACTGTVVDITQQMIMLYIPSGDFGLRHINIYARELLHDKVIVGIEILHKVENPSNLNEPFLSDDDDSDDDDDDDSPKYDVITETEED